MNTFDLDAVLRRLPGRRISYFTSIDSTMNEAGRLAAAGVRSGTAVVAEEQTAGQGRHGHSWHSEPGCGLYCSIVVRPRLGVERMPILTVTLGLAAVEAISRATGLLCDIRWPNDLMLDGRKTAGILVHMYDSTAVAGLGINVNHTEFPAEIADQATSLRRAGGREYSREDILTELLTAVDEFLEVLETEGNSAILDLFEHRSSYARGRRVRVEEPGGDVIGTTDGLDPAGFLRVRLDDGGERLILAGGVRALSA